MSEPVIKESIMKTLLTSPKMNGELRKKFQSYNTSDVEGYGGLKLNNHLQKNHCKSVEKVCPYELDHSYCKPWNWRPENTFMKPVENLFIPKSENVNELNSDDELDILGNENLWKPFYDVGKAKVLMDECKKHISLVRADEGDPLWDSKVDRMGWTVAQSRLFDRTCRILNNDRLGRLAISNSQNEPMLRRIQVNKSARRFRSLMSIIYWEPKLTHWLHTTLLETLEKNYLVAYIDILQTLKSKIPLLIERLLQGSSSPNTNSDALNILVQRPWDPASLIYPTFSLRKLPGNPILLLVPGTPGSKPRPNRWLPYLSQLGSLVTVTTNALNQSKVTLISSLEHMLSSTRMKLADLRKECPSRQIILVGFNSGSALACQVALLDFVSAVVCLGFPMKTVEGLRGQPDDILTTFQVPVLFVIGQHAASASVDEMEELRERLTNCETGLVVVGGGDDHLRVPKSIQHAEGVTQHVVDRCIIEEVGDFLGQMGGKKEESASMSRSRIKLVERKRKVSEENTRPVVSAASLAPSLSAQPVSHPSIVTTTSRRGRKPRGTRGGRGTGGRWSNRHLMINPSGSTSTPIVKFPQIGRGRFSSLSSQDGLSLKRSADSTSPGGTTTILVSDILQNSGDNALDGDGPSIPQIKVVGSEGGSSSETFLEGSSLVDQLTPDRLLEMPVIIAHDDTPRISGQQQVKILVRQAGRGRGGIKCIPRSTTATASPLHRAKIILRKKDQQSGNLVTLDMSHHESSAPKKTFPSDIKTRVFHIPATKYSDN